MFPFYLKKENDGFFELSNIFCAGKQRRHYHFVIIVNYIVNYIPHCIAYIALFLLASDQCYILFWRCCAYSRVVLS